MSKTDKIVDGKLEITEITTITKEELIVDRNALAARIDRVREHNLAPLEAELSALDAQIAKFN